MPEWVGEKRWKCKECYGIVTQSEVLIAPHIFAVGGEISGCPHCFAVNSFEPVCEAAGCDRVAGVGAPWFDGVYRWTCFVHHS